MNTIMNKKGVDTMKKYRVDLFDMNGKFKMYLDFDKMHDVRKLVECFPKENRPIIMIWNERMEAYSFFELKGTSN